MIKFSFCLTLEVNLELMLLKTESFVHSGKVYAHYDTSYSNIH